MYRMPLQLASPLACLSNRTAVPCPALPCPAFSDVSAVAAAEEPRPLSHQCEAGEVPAAAPGSGSDGSEEGEGAGASHAGEGCIVRSGAGGGGTGAAPVFPLLGLALPTARCRLVIHTHTPRPSHVPGMRAAAPLLHTQQQQQHHHQQQFHQQQQEQEQQQQQEQEQQQQQQQQEQQHDQQGAAAGAGAVPKAAGPPGRAPVADVSNQQDGGVSMGERCWVA